MIIIIIHFKRQFFITFVDGVDYEINQTSITIPNGTLEDEEYCITITIIGDDQMESNEVFEVTFTPQNEVDVFNGPPTVSITIMDDGDGKDSRGYLYPFKY